MSNNQHENRSRFYLRSLHIDAYGGLSQRDVGPFTSGLNVMYGGNEAGKTTIASFIGGVLFGWEDARGRRNVYRPVNAHRSGSLVFSDANGEGETVRLSRVRNAEGVSSDRENDILSDIDKDTFKTVFSLNSDELRRLGKTNDVTARLLTAGSGTSVSPAWALSEVDRRLAACLSKSSNYPDSITNCKSELEHVRDQLAEARRETDRFMREDREFKELEPLMNELQKGLAQSNHDVESLSVQRDALIKLEAERQRIEEREADLDAEETELDAMLDYHWNSQDGKYPAMDAVEEQSVREGMDELLEERSRLDSAISLAKNEYSASKASFEALCESEDSEELKRSQNHQRRVRLATSSFIPALFAVMGVPIFVNGRMANSLSFMVFGGMLVLSAVFIAFMAAVMLFRPNPAQQEYSKRLKDSQWVMLQDKKKYEALLAEREEHNERVLAFLKENGLEQAQGSLRRARVLLDGANRSRSEWRVLDQRRQSLTAQRVSLDDQRRRNEQAQEEALCAAGLETDASLETVEELLRMKTDQREAQLKTSASYSARYGELKQQLAQGRRMRSFDSLKLKEQMIRTRLDEALGEYARLLMARRILVSAITAWESNSQPRVYQHASRLMSLMTNGRWVQVDIGPEGGLQVIDEFDTVREPTLLSMGTCQQLYLALRIALLLTAENVGYSIPILADDILVNFDDGRRKGAARALAELAQNRQVIVFTCHEEVVRLMQESCSDVNLIRL